MFQLQQLSNYGTSTPAVARTLLQGDDILGFVSASEDQKTACKKVLMELQRHLVRCVEIAEGVSKEISSAKIQIAEKGFRFQAAGRAVTLPSVPDVHSRAEGFLQSAKMATREAARQLEPFFGGKHDHRLNKVVAWATDKFGPTDSFTASMTDWEPWVKSVVTMRNAVDHPSDEPAGKLIVSNFVMREEEGSNVLVDPTWCLTGETERPMLDEMNSIIEGTIQLGEDILAQIFYKLRVSPIIDIFEIPVQSRRPECPKRLVVSATSLAIAKSNAQARGGSAVG